MNQVKVKLIFWLSAYRHPCLFCEYSSCVLHNVYLPKFHYFVFLQLTIWSWCDTFCLPIEQPLIYRIRSRKSLLLKHPRNLLWLPDTIKSRIWVYLMQFHPFLFFKALQHCDSSLTNCCVIIKLDWARTFLFTLKPYAARHQCLLLLLMIKQFRTCGRASPFPSETLYDNV